jgi:hypothetical protein
MHWTELRPLYVVAGFLIWGFAFVVVSDISDWIKGRSRNG